MNEEEAKLRADYEKLAKLGMKALIAFLEGKAFFVVTEGNTEGSQIIHFQMPTEEPS